MKHKSTEDNTHSPTLEEQMVVNPFTNKKVNITPLWRVLNEHYSDDLSELEEQLDGVIQTISTKDTADMELQELKEVLYDLFNLKSMIHLMHKSSV